MKSIEQLQKWVDRESIHNDENDRCLPDNSCCILEMDTPIKERQAFLIAFSNGDLETTQPLLDKWTEQSIAILAERK